MLRAFYALLLVAFAHAAQAQTITTFAGGDGAQAIQAEAIAADRWGNIYTAEPTHHVVRRIDHRNGTVTIIAGTGQAGYRGDGGPATQAQLGYPTGVALDRAGNVFIGDSGNARVVRRVDRETGIIATVAGPGTPNVPNRGDGGPATEATVFANDVAVNREGDLYIADSAAGLIRRVDHRTGIISTVVELGATYIVTMAFDPRGVLYVVDPVPPNVVRVDASTGTVTKVAGAGTTCQQIGGSACYNGDGVLATDALLNFPTHITFDCAGNLTISDTFNFRVRQVNRHTGIITTIAGSGMDGHSGDGGPATQAGILSGPRELAFGPEGDLFFAEAAGSTGYIRKVSGLPKAHRCEERHHRDGEGRGHRPDSRDGDWLRPWW
ncbi:MULTISPECIES: hypothetical protein [unclassified Caballeronia]|uniref:NHL domain-containing protein n=1 Tax=unclassified Caballeronia TaxID=2646786 RepID=UPI002029B05F|nr:MULTISPECIES: hypothetical protein [unclassified Caballeronia]